MVVVTATRSPVPLAETTGDVSVIDAAQIAAAGQSTLLELLRTLPGVEVSSQGGPGQPATVFLRGANSNHTVVLIDGVRQTSLNLGLGSLQSLPLAAVERVEVLRAPASGLYGADAVGGVIQVFTKAASGGNGVSVGVGDYGRRRADVNLAGNVDGLRWGVSVGEDRSSGFDAVLPSNFAHHPDHDAHKQQALQASLAKDFSEQLGLSLKWLSASNRTGIDAEFPPYSSAPNARSKQDISNLALVVTSRLHKNWLSTLQLGENRDTFRWQDTLSFDDRIENTTKLVSWQNDLDFGAHRLRLGVENQQQDVRAEATAYGQHERTTRSVLAGYQVASDGHTLRADLRQDRIAGYGDVNSGNLGYSLRLAPQWVADVRWGKAFKLPTFNDLYYVDPWGYFVPNAKLTPETGRTLEAGLIHQTAKTRVGLHVFSSRIEDLIINYDADGFMGPQPGTVINAGLAKIHGLTADAHMTLTAWALRGALTWQDARDATTDQRLPRRARVHGSLIAERNYGVWHAGVELLAQGTRFDSLPNSEAGELAGYAVTNLRVAYVPNQTWSVQARWNNVFDKTYALAQGYPTPGSNVFVDLRFALP